MHYFPSDKNLVKRGNRVSLTITRQRITFISILTVVIGILSGLGAFLVVHLVGLISNLALLHRIGYNLPNLHNYHPNWTLIPTALAGGAAVSAIAKFAPIIKGHGIPESIEAILRHKSRIKPRSAIAKPVSAAIAMGTGGPFGAEGPIIVTGAAIGSLLGQLLPVSTSERRILLATGAAAGMAGIFGTPLAAIMLAFELLLFERSLRTLVPLMVACGISAEIHNLLITSQPLFELHHDVQVPIDQLPIFLITGLMAGILAVCINKGLFAFERGFRRLNVPDFTKPILGALGFSLIGLVVPGSLSVGYWAIADAVNNRFLLGTALILMIGKLFSWQIALASDTSGGTLAPMLIIGATLGEVIGIVTSHIFPGLHIYPGYFAIVAMGVTFGVGTRALFTGAIFAAEVTGSYDLLIWLFIAMVIGELFAQHFLTDRIMTDKLTRRNLSVDFDTTANILKMTTVGDIMTPFEQRDIDDGIRALNYAVTVDQAIPILQNGIKEIPVTNDAGQGMGMITAQSIVEVLYKGYKDEQIESPTLQITFFRDLFATFRQHWGKSIGKKQTRPEGQTVDGKHAQESKDTDN